METVLIKAAQLIVALAFLVIIHEFGHYIFARIFGIKVEKFYMFFDPYFSLFKWKPKPKKNADPNKTSWRDTEYGIGWIPLGGYCKIAGMIDESMDTEQMKQEPKPWEFRTKPAYQRLLVMLGGVLFNFILAILIYAGIAMHWGAQYIPFDAATEGFDFVPAAQEAGFRNGDIPLMADGKKLDASQSDYPYQMAEANVVTVLRNKKDTIDIHIPENFIFRLNDDKGFLGYRVPVYIERVVPGEAAAKAGLQEGDHIVAVDSIATPTFTELTPTLMKYAGKETSVTVERDGNLVTVPITPNEYGKLGFQLRPITAIYPPVTISYGFFESFPKGWEIGTTTLGNYVSSMKHVFSSEGAQSLGGFGAIGNMFPEKWNWLSFWEITAFLSVALAFMNIIPIPGLDGGHVMFLLWEIITRRKPSEKVLIAAQYVGMAFLLLLLLYANGNDIFRAFLK
ncbi:MAG: RIP metalloprotease RseP [Muribaculaceae bacterium]|nr:RIP metalloprotease RseP [Muribaculaceae bacterium]